MNPHPPGHLQTMAGMICLSVSMQRADMEEEDWST